MIHPPVRVVGGRKKTEKRKEGRKERKKIRHPNSGKLSIRPDRRIKIKLCGV